MTATESRPAGRRAAAGLATDRASRILLACQHPDGSWPDRAAAAVTLTAEALLVREVLGIRTAALTAAAAAQIRASQRADGSWAGGEPGAAADLSASVLAYLALRLAGESPDAYHMAAGAGWIRDAGGLDSAGVHARAWLATFGMTAWASVPVPSPEVVWLAAAGTAEWSRVEAVTLAILGALRPVHRLPVELAELGAQTGRRGAAAVPAERPAAAVRAARAAVRPAALHRCGRWLAGWQCCPAQSGSPRPVWPASVVALHLLGYSFRDPAQAAGLAWLDSVSRGPAGPGLPPVAQTALAAGALRCAGLAADHRALADAGRWLLQHRVEGPAAGPARARLAPCGWSFCPDGYPRPGDTALVLLALAGIEPPGLAGWPVLGTAARWLAGSQDRDGSWDCSAAVTAYCVGALAAEGRRDAEVARAVRRGVVWLLRAQLPPGGWPGRDGGSDLLATTASLPALLAAGVLPGKPAVSRAVDWLLSQQNGDGGWGAGDVACPRRPGDSDAPGTASALAALLAAGGNRVADRIAAAADWLVRTQLPDGSWAGLPGRSHGPGSPAAGVPLPLAALGQYRAALDGAGDCRDRPGNLAERVQHPPSIRAQDR